MDKYGIYNLLHELDIIALQDKLNPATSNQSRITKFLRINSNIVKYCTLKNWFIKVNKSSFGSSLEKLYRQNSGKPLNSGKIPVDRGVRYWGVLLYLKLLPWRCTLNLWH